MYVVRSLIFQRKSFPPRAVMPEPGGPGGPLAPPIFCRSVNPIQTGEGRLSPPITTGPLNVFHLPASLLNLLPFYQSVDTRDIREHKVSNDEKWKFFLLSSTCSNYQKI